MSAGREKFTTAIASGRSGDMAGKSVSKRAVRALKRRLVTLRKRSEAVPGRRGVLMRKAINKYLLKCERFLITKNVSGG